MFENMSEQEARKQILGQVAEYCDIYHKKKNFEKFNNALSIISDIDLYKYNYKHEADGSKKHIGFVIGENYNYSSEITSLNDKGEEIGADLYAMASLCLQAIKEQQTLIEELKREIKQLKEMESEK